MENRLNQQSNILLNRIKLSNLRSTGPLNRIQQDNQRRLKSLSTYKRKLKLNSFGKIFSSTQDKVSQNNSSWKQNHANRQVEKLLSHYSSQQQNVQQGPSFNLRKGTRLQQQKFKSNIIRKPFTNISNIKNDRKQLQLTRNIKDEKKKKFNLNLKNSMSLAVNRLITVNQEKININNMENSFTYHKTKVQLSLASQNASIVNDIFTFVKNKTSSGDQFIGEYTEVVFKLVCYFFVSKINHHHKSMFDAFKLFNFVDQQILQSYKKIPKFSTNASKNSSKKSLFSNEYINNSYEDIPQIIRKQNRVISFFKHVQMQQIQQTQQQGSNSRGNVNKSSKNSTFNQIQINTNQKSPHNLLNLPAQSRNSVRRISIAINSIQQDKKEDNSDSYSYSESNVTQRQTQRQTQKQTQRQTQRQKQTQQINSKSHLLAMNVRGPNTKRKSIFLTDSTAFQRQNVFMKQSTKNIQEDYNFKDSTNQLNIISKKDCIDQKSSYSRLQMGSKRSISNKNQQSCSSLASKSKISSKMNLNLKCPYDFQKQDSLMTKRIKYLQLHQKIIQMSDNIEDLRQQQKHINRKIQQKDQQLHELQLKVSELRQQAIIYEKRNKQAQQFLIGPQCPKMAQNIIKKKGQIQKNLKSLINYNAWYSSNLSQTTHIQNIFQTKQSSIEKLNSFTRKLRGCKDIQQIQCLVSQMRQIVLITIQKYSQIITQFQDKIKELESSRSNMLKNLEDWQMETKIKEKLVNNSFLDYYSVERKVSTYIDKLPESLVKIQNFISILIKNCNKRNSTMISSTNNFNIKSTQKMNSKNVINVNSNNNSLNIENISKQINQYLNKMKIQNSVVSKQLFKQKRFAMVLQKVA